MKQNTNERIEAVVNYSGMSRNHFAKHIGLLRGENLYQIRKGNNGISLDASDREYEYTPYANKRSVWEVATQPFKEAHFAVYPEKLIVDCIKAGCPDNGDVLDPFFWGGVQRLSLLGN